MGSASTNAPPDVRVAARIALVAALLLPWCFIWQGVDVTDQGYLLTIYRQFLHHPEAVSQAAHMWLTNTLGGIVDALFGGLGVIAHRAQWALCVSAGMWIAFNAIRRVTAPTPAAAAVLVACVFLVNRRESWFSYNVLTALINVAAIHFMSRGLAERNARYLLASGFLLGASPFARFPNVLGLALLAGPLFAELLTRRRGVGWLKELGLVAAGVLAGALTVLGCIAASGGLKIYTASLAGLFAPAVDKTGHGTAALLRQFFQDQSAALLAGGLTAAVAVSAFFLSRSWSRPLRLLLVLLPVALAVRVLVFTGSGRDPEYWRQYVLGTCCIGLLALALGLGDRSRELRVQAFLATIALVVTPLGSDGGTRNSHWGLWLGLPLLLASCLSFDEQGRLRGLREVGLAFAAFVGIEGAVRCFSYTYREAPRAQLTQVVTDRQLRWQYTSEARARNLSQVMQALHARIMPGDYLLTSESVPLLQYLTSTRPYLSIPWIMVDEDPAQLDQLLRSVPPQRGCLPLLVRARGNARSPAWPYDVRRGLDRHHIAARKVIGKFLKRHAYRVVWSNDFFEILEAAASSELKTDHCR